MQDGKTRATRTDARPTPPGDTCPTTPIPSAAECRRLLGRWRARREAARTARQAHDAASRAVGLAYQFGSPLVDSLAAALNNTVGDLTDKACEGAAAAEEEAARALHAHGPVEDGVERYEGVDVYGMWCVVRTALPFKPDEGEDAPPVAGHACTDVVVVDDTGEAD